MLNFDNFFEPTHAPNPHSEDFDQYGWTQVSLNSYSSDHPEASTLFPNTMALLKESGVPYGPRDLCVVRCAPNSGLPDHRHVVLDDRRRA